MQEAEEDSDPDYDPDNVEAQQGVEALGPDMSQVLASINDIKAFMIQRFNDQDVHFLEINHRFDTQETQFDEIKDQFHRWNTSLGVSTEDFFPASDDINASFNPNDVSAP